MLANLRHPLFYILDKFIHLKVAFCLQISKKCCQLGLLLPNFEAARTMKILQKSMNAIVTFNVGDWFSNFYLQCLNQVF